MLLFAIPYNTLNDRFCNFAANLGFNSWLGLTDTIWNLKIWALKVAYVYYF